MKIISSIFHAPAALIMALLGTRTVTQPVEAASFAAFNSKEQLQDVVINEYCRDEANWRFNALYGTYGPIEQWDVSSITDMSQLFYGQTTCNPPIGDWNVSSVTDFGEMFAGANAFNQPIGNWDVSSGEYFVSKCILL
jgi:hypothetical protein